MTPQGRQIAFKASTGFTFIVEKLGTEAEFREKLNGRDPYEWAKEYKKVFLFHS